MPKPAVQLATYFLCCLTLVRAVHGNDGQPTQAERLFALRVQPLLQEKCVACHGADPEQIEGGLDLRTRDGLLRGGDFFEDQVLVPGKAEESYLYAVVRRVEEDFEMPPKQADRLTLEQTWWIRDWINGGAPWPDEQRVAEIYEQYAEGVTVATSGGLSDEWTNRKYDPADLWAWQKLQASDPRRDGQQDRNPIDVFIENSLAAEGLRPAKPADRRTLIRRATFDLLGLPPTPAEVEQYVQDPRGDEVVHAELVERLLASPHYGEQWGRHWLDFVRYADSSGFANDWERPNAWRYRDYVIRAFNEDKPYDQFIREQIAGDEIYRREAAGPTPTDQQQTTSTAAPSPELLIAAGFLRMGPWEHTGMSVAKVTRQQFLDDITDAVGQVFLANALQCCRCHDHKFDPIPTRDYYAMQSIFATTQFAEVDADWLPSENLEGMEQDEHYHLLRQNENSELLARLSEKKRENDRKWFEQRNLPYKTRQEAIKAGAPKDHIPPSNVLKTPNDFGRERIGRKWQRRFEWELDRYQPIAFTVYNGYTRLPRNASERILPPEDPTAEGVLEETTILKGGNVFSPSEPVSPGVLSAAPGADEFEIPDSLRGRRSALAEWIASPENPLTARVMANRIWQFHFGQPIAGNPNNFGATGKKPTHPELLDWLAAELMRPSFQPRLPATERQPARPWSIKHLHRVIMKSDAYRRGFAPANLQELAATNGVPEISLETAQQTYAVFPPRRLTAEELRDAMLAVSGELNRTLGGIPCRPDMNLEAALQPRMIMGTFAPSYVPNALPKQRNRRSIYALKLRGHRDPFMETFNQPGSENSCEMRDSSTISPQALTLLNSRETADRCLALAARVSAETDSAAAAVDRLYQLAYARSPDGDELADGLAHWERMTTIESQIDYPAPQFPTTVVREANEENTGEIFTFTEKLFEYENYVPDLSPHEVDARTRGLANLCQAILNSNEFIFVY